MTDAAATAQAADLGALLRPRSVAVIGASEDAGKFGGRVLRLLVQHGFAGAIYPINRTRETLLGLPAYPSVESTPTPPDLAVMAVPRDAVPEAVAACARAGTRAAIVITARFSDAGEAGAALEREIVGMARAAGMRLMGPNCLGLVSPVNRLVLCSSPSLFDPNLPMGRIGLISSSGALMATMLDRARTRGIGLSHAFSIGNQADLDLADYLDGLATDPHTAALCAYVEGVKDAPRFLAAACRVRAAGKPLLIVKAGRSEAGAAAAFSHTAALTGSHAAFTAACRDVGALVLDDLDAMIPLAESLIRHPAPLPEAVAVLTPSGGAGALAADRLAGAGLPLAALGGETVARLAAWYPPGEPPGNPVDLGATRGDGLNAAAGDLVAALMAAPEVGAVLAPLTTAPDMARIAALLADGAEAAGQAKPLIGVLHPGAAADEARRVLTARGVLHGDSLDEAARVLTGHRAWAALQPRPRPARPADLPPAPPALPPGALGEATAKAALAAYGVPVNRGETVADAAAAVAAASRLRPPFAVKVVSPDIVHKSDAGGVALDLPDAEAAAAAVGAMAACLAQTHPAARIEGYLVQEMARGHLEVLIGARRDPQFGPMITVGAGGVLAELLADVVTACAPVDAATARAMLESLRLAPLLAGHRGGPPLDLVALAETVSRVSWLAADLGDRFAELDLNPVLVGAAGEGCVAVDARLLMEETA
jgi:acetyl-CoA synthetase (ADP-forming)